MSIGLLLVCVELFFMISMLVFLPGNLVGPCFIGFAIGESLGASALRIGGGLVVASRALPSAVAVDRILLDALQLAHERYGVAGAAFYLLRPDTYVAARGPLSDADDLLEYLSTVFV